MIGFDKIVVSLLHELGYEPDICQSEEEARIKASSRLHDNTTTRNHTLVKSSSRAVVPSSTYPVYFFPSDTSGEKPYEEFCTESEIADMESYSSLGVIKNAKKRSLSEIETILNNLESLFKKENITKADIVETLQEYLPTFAHLETGKGLDQKM
jgi:hypothetical protein